MLRARYLMHCPDVAGKSVIDIHRVLDSSVPPPRLDALGETSPDAVHEVPV